MVMGLCCWGLHGLTRFIRYKGVPGSSRKGGCLRVLWSVNGLGEPLGVVGLEGPSSRVWGFACRLERPQS